VTEDAVIITSDQVIEVDGQVREKPESVEVCKQYLRSYSEGKPAVCHVGIVVYNTRTKERLVGSAIARQYFKPSQSFFFLLYRLQFTFDCEIRCLPLVNLVTWFAVCEVPESFYDELIAQGDCMWCAGGFCVEQMEQYADRLEGEIECVQGLPKALTIDLLNKIGFQK
jgi:predicted house-cleaning NTP pyrophosphatase (Maf/HAM1 superfamily)